MSNTHCKSTRFKRTRFKSTRFRTFAGLLFAIAIPAAAGETSGTITLTSDYLFRGITQTGEDPALQAGIEQAFAGDGSDGGFYIGAWGSNISWLADADPAISSSLELDGTLGYRGGFGDRGVSYDVGAIYYWYPGDYPPGFNEADTAEVYFGLGWEFLSLKYSHAVTDLFGIPDSDGSGALELGASCEFAPAWSLDAVVGKQWVRNLDGADYAWWKLGVGKAFDSGFDIAVAYNDNDLIGPDETWTVALSKSF